MKPYWIVLLLLAGCASVAFQPEPKGVPMLDEGIKSYKEGRYREAVTDIQGALDAGLSKNDQVKAHKFLAFTYCVSRRETLCREEFGKALAIDPEFDLTMAEAGHPMWGSVFRSVKRNIKQ